MTNPTQDLEYAIVAAGANIAPRITPADIAANIVSEHYFTAADGIAGAAINNLSVGNNVVSARGRERIKPHAFTAKDSFDF